MLIIEQYSENKAFAKVAVNDPTKRVVRTFINASGERKTKDWMNLIDWNNNKAHTTGFILTLEGVNVNEIINDTIPF